MLRLAEAEALAQTATPKGEFKGAWGFLQEFALFTSCGRPQNAGNARDGILHVGGRASRESIVGSPRAGKMNSKYVFKWISTVWKSAGVT